MHEEGAVDGEVLDPDAGGVFAVVQRGEVEGLVDARDQLEAAVDDCSARVCCGNLELRMCGVREGVKV